MQTASTPSPYMRSTHHEPSFSDAVRRVADAGQRMVRDRIELARLDAATIAGRTLRGVVMIAAGAVLLSGAWFALMTGAVLYLNRYLMMPASVAIVAGATLLVGALLVYAGSRRTRNEITGENQAERRAEAREKLHGDGRRTYTAREAHA